MDQGRFGRSAIQGLAETRHQPNCRRCRQWIVVPTGPGSCASVAARARVSPRTSRGIDKRPCLTGRDSLISPSNPTRGKLRAPRRRRCTAVKRPPDMPYMIQARYRIGRTQLNLGTAMPLPRWRSSFHPSGELSQRYRRAPTMTPITKGKRFDNCGTACHARAAARPGPEAATALSVKGAPGHPGLLHDDAWKDATRNT